MMPQSAELQVQLGVALGTIHPLTVVRVSAPGAGHNPYTKYTWSRIYENFDHYVLHLKIM